MTDNLAQENTDLRAQLIAALNSCYCPHRTRCATEYNITIGECVGRGECGCEVGDLIRTSQRIAS